MTIPSENLILDVVYNITSTAMPKINKIAQYLYSTMSPEDATTENYFISFQTDETTENLVNSTLGLVNSFEISEESNITLLENSFVDYLTYVLNSFILDSNYSDILYNGTNSTEDNYTFSTTMDDYDSFKSTVLPFVFNYTDVTTESRFDEELYSIYDDISSSITTLKEVVSSSVATTTLVPIEYTYEHCNKTCEDTMFKDTYSTITSIMPINISSLNYTDQAKLRSLCWETMFGQELIKLTVMDMIMTFVSTLCMDFFRGLFIRIMNR